MTSITEMRVRRGVVTTPDGRIGHVELVLGKGVVSLGLLADDQPKSSLPTRATLLAMTLVFVEDVDAAVERAPADGGR